LTFYDNFLQNKVTGGNMKHSMILWVILSLLIGAGLQAAEPISIETETEYNQYLISSLSNDNIGIRVSAAQLLGERKIFDSKPALIEMLKNDKHYEARIIAVWALTQFGDEQLVEIFKQQLKKEKNQTVQHVLVGAINELTKAES
jgi:HEAT repeat protein